MKKLSVALVLTIGPLGCGAPAEGILDENVAAESAPLTNSPFTLRNFQTGLCMGVKAGTPTVGTPMIVWTCDNSANQTWTKGPPSSSDPAFILLKNGVAPDRCLYDGHTNGQQAWIGTCNPVFAPYNAWKPIFAGTDSLGHECFRFASQGGPTKVLGVKGGSTTLGTPVVIWSDFNNSVTHPDQLWCTH
jgi:hypothetical protein